MLSYIGFRTVKLAEIGTIEEYRRFWIDLHWKYSNIEHAHRPNNQKLLHLSNIPACNLELIAPTNQGRQQKLAALVCVILMLQ
ncbi:hypothetical protein DFP97_12142 [Paenibacillus prosopidis]|uniref:Uncharacterized protein n=1 Tax=Paenibacillus prosopidis TaxID=630520 RepID=A0A368VJH9_9BACL|nr:hypothetical protein DFP97_12142 [Paenibacillus prosopidis]